jgi:hypothetical protein
MTRQATPDLSRTVVEYLDEAGDLIAELSEATAHDPAARDLAMRLANWFGRFQNQAGEFIPGYETDLDVSH